MCNWQLTRTQSVWRFSIFNTKPQTLRVHLANMVDPAIVQLAEQLQHPLMQYEQAFVIADCELPDMPLVFASQHFLEMTG